MWDLVQSADWNVTVRSVERRIDPIEILNGQLVRANGHFVVFRLDLTNHADQPLVPAAADFALLSEDGKLMANKGGTEAARALAIAGNLTPYGQAVPPGATVTTILLFDADRGASRLTLRFAPANQLIQIDECKCNLPSPVVELRKS
jgi:uncharacterized protein DUF4352